MPKILLVANPGDHDELSAALRGGDDDELSSADVLREVGDDATLARFVDVRPEVVVVVATLEDGDARALISAMRDAILPAQPFVVMVGDSDGPMRTALDAIGAGIDRFVTRPLSAKALRFAVASGLARAAIAMEQQAPPPLALARITPVRVEPVAPAPVAAPDLRARWSALADQLGDDDDSDDAADAAPPAPIAPVATRPVAVLVDDDPPDDEEVGDADVIDEDLIDDALAAELLDDDPDVPDRIVVSVEDLPTSRASTTRPPAHATPPPPPHAHTTPPPVHATPPPPPHAHATPPAPDAAAMAAGSADEVTTIPPPVGDAAPAVLPPSAVVPAIAPDDAAPAIALGSDSAPAIAPPDDVAPAIALVSDPAPAIALVSDPVPAIAPPDDATSAIAGASDDAITIPPPMGDTLAAVPPVIPIAPPPAPRPLPPPLRAPTIPPPPPLPPPPPDAWRPGSTEVPEPDPSDVVAPLPIREPTLVLAERSLPEEPTGELGPIGWRIAAPGPLVDDLEDDPLEDVADGIDDELSVDLPGERPRDVAVTPPPVTAPPAGGDFARELRKKMSLMAERLFRGGDLPAAPVSIGPAHDHHTEIDLGGLVDEGDDDVDLAAATFVGVEERLTDPHSGGTRETRETRDPRGAEGGELQRGVADAPALIARMFAGDFTGRVVFRHRDAEKIVHFEGGRPVFASSNLVRDRMGELLVREGKITREQHDRCHDLVRDTGRRMGEILVDRGYLKRRELLPAVRRHVEDILYSLFAWDTGEYRIVAGDGATAERIRLSRHPAAMVLEGVRRKLDRATLERLVGPPTALIETTDRDKLAATIGVADLAAEERAALAALDGATDLTAVARAASLSLANLYPLVWSLQLLGLATTRRRPGDDEGDAPALVGESDLAIDRDRVRARAALVADADYFALLGVRRDATGFEIKRAYEAARRDFAHESFPGELRRELEGELDEIAVVLDEAYRVLRDDGLRVAYRAHLREPGEAA